MSTSKFTVSSTNAGQRLDIFCTASLPAYSRTALQRAIKDGQITVNDQIVKPRYSVREDDIIRIGQLELSNQNAQQPRETLTLTIIYENKDIVVINKPAGILVHPRLRQGYSGQATQSATILDWFTNRYPESIHGGLVHRLDKDTSGVLALARTQDAYNHLKNLFKKHRVKKEYLALVFGVPNAKEGRITRPITRSRRNPLRRTIVPSKILTILTGKPAITEWKTEKTFKNKYALLRVFPLTGRTHQIRVHLHFLGHPIIGDPLYTFKRQKPPPGVTRQLLHAAELTLTLPNGTRKTFTAPLPEDFSRVVSSLKSH